MHVTNGLRFLRTIRNLRTSQLYWRLRYLMEHRLRPAQRLVGNAEQWSGISSVLRGGGFPAVPLFHRPGLTDGQTVQRLSRGEFHHLHQPAVLQRGCVDWLAPGQATDRLWAVTLHYHYWVYELAEAHRAGHPEALPLLFDYLDDWLTHCDVRRIGADNLIWDPFAVATRLSWWIRSLVLLGGETFDERPQWERRLLESIALQADFLSKHIEWDLRGNHLMRDAVGLAWAGRFLKGPQAERWLRQAESIAAGQLREQVLPDGGHFERSPMYHLHVMEDVLSLALLLPDGTVREQARRTWSSMTEYALWMRHPDGSIPLFNDAALHAVCDSLRMLELGETIGVPCEPALPQGGRHFADSGVVVWHGDPWTVFFDVGEIGPAYQPGHAHADTLTLECSFRGRRLCVDPGTHSYDHDEQRAYDRSTQAHNTVCINGADSSEVWHIFRVGARAMPDDVHVELTADSLCACASHDGYDNRSGSPRHTRRLQVGNGTNLEIVDRIEGRGRQRLEGGYLLHPDWTARPHTNGWILTNGPLTLNVAIHSNAKLHLTQQLRPYHPEYGMEQQTRRLQWTTTARVPIEVRTVMSDEISRK